MIFSEKFLKIGGFCELFTKCRPKPGTQCRPNAGRARQRRRAQMPDVRRGIYKGAHEMEKYYIIIIYCYVHLMCAEMARFIIK